MITATLADTFHDVGLTLQAGGGPLTVVPAWGADRLSLDQVCREAGADLAARMGGTQVCIHLLDLCPKAARDLTGGEAGSPA